MQNNGRPEVVVLTTGGTIASRPDPSGGVVAAVAGEELLSTAPEIREMADVRVEDVFRVGGYLMKPDDMLEIARRVRATLEDGSVSGVVITHGTDTMEETAYLVDLLYGGERPVVFTGAQRNASVPDTDGPRNLAAAVRLAAHPAARGLGAVISMGGTVEAAREGAKIHTTALRAFASPGYGPVGAISEGSVHIFRRRVRPTNLARELSGLPRVDLVKLVAGSDGTFVRAAREAGAAGIIIEAFGIGNGNHEILAEVRRSIEAGVAVVVVSRCPEGYVAPVYGNGGGYDLKEAGAIFGVALSGQKARILLMVALAAARESGERLEALLAPHLEI